MKKTTKGFTIIEVVLVLAIAGLIFLVVFLALPALQRQQRDTQRRSDASRVLTAVQNYQSNNGGAVPNLASIGATGTGTFVTSYVQSGSNFNDPSGSAYAIRHNAGATNGSATVPANTINYHEGATCTGENATAGTSRQAAVRVALENGGTFCSTNAN